ncbi:hypothetical protein SAMN05660206_102196 [Sphingobacterium wenxiniae]|uniref:Uncharacterized protein n=1 Tax=Sphingobacterium wenxiniae TaxID=683125 RepID=A0A1I6Q904_9SPHI|nr:hypothetical protein SAMN05660206_102196 [Sphingobacterium wenxiniae]
MKDFISNKLTIFFALGLISSLAVILFASILISGHSAPDELAGIYLLFTLIPLVVLLIADRICVRKFGTKSVNKIQFYILGSIILLFIINWVRLQTQA